MAMMNEMEYRTIGSALAGGYRAAVSYTHLDVYKRQPHAHVMLTMRAMDEHGKWLPKSRKVYDLDESGERIKLPSGITLKIQVYRK